MTLINTIGYLAFFFILSRISILIILDTRRKKNTFIKFLFGAYVFEAMIPSIKEPASEKEAKLIKLGNICLIAFYTLFLTVLLLVWIKFRNVDEKQIRDNNKVNQTALVIKCYNSIYRRI